MKEKKVKLRSTRALALFLTIILTITLSAPVSVSAADSLKMYAKGAAVMDAETGKILWGKNENTRMVPASLTKLMTAFVVYEAIDNGEFTMETEVPLSDYVIEFSRNDNFSNVPLYEDTVYTVQDLMEAMLIKSACAASIALAQFTAGTHSEFIKLMNDEAKALQLNAVFKDAYGGSSSNLITPASAAQLGRALLIYHPEILDITSKKSFTINGTTYSSSNRLVREADPLSNPDAFVDGLKTGTTKTAGVCLCSSAGLDGKRVICVVFKEDNTTNLYSDSRAGLKYGLERAKVFDTSDMIGNFCDVDGTKWYADAVQTMLDTELMIGVSKYFFLPDSTLTRAQVAQILYNYAGNPAVGYDGTYSDVKASDWFAPAISWCIENDMLVSSGSDKINPNGAIERQEMITMLYRYMLYIGEIDEQMDDEILTNYSDISKIRDYAEFPISWAVTEGLIQGMGNDKLSPASYTTRAQMAQLLTRLVG